MGTVIDTPGHSSGRAAAVRRLFDAASSTDPPGREALLAAARAEHPSVCAEVEALLRCHDRGGSLLDAGAAGAAAVLLPAGAPKLDPAPPPGRIGRYRIVRELGRGGMGVVYEAEQEFPHRRVALKIVRAELVTPSLLRRFTHEAEALALLQHPGIAQLFEAGFDEDSGRRPYIAMELVEGRSISAHARTLPVRARVELMVRACDAVEHAHRRGVIHRDLKPGNILVDAQGQPKILDFGVARLTGADAPDHAVTSVGQMIGTLGYMSPEQVSGDTRAVDSRCDVYALGAILYELLAGGPPVDIAGMGLAQAALALREGRPFPLGRVDPALRGDLETIAAKALEKDPQARYQSAADLGADLRRFLAGEPIAARRDSSLYVLQKQLRRYRWVLTTAAAFLVLVASFAVWARVMAESYRRLAASEGEARTSESAARAALAAQLRASNLERARLLVESGSAPDGEAIIWDEHLRDPGAEDTLWALRDTYARYPCLASLEGHQSLPQCVAVSRDGTRVVSGDAAGELRIWDVRSGACVATVETGEAVRGLALLPDGRSVLIARDGGTLSRLDLETGQVVASAAAHAPGGFAITLSPDATLVATAGGFVLRTGGSVQVWDAGTLEPVAGLGRHTDAIAHVVFSADGARLATSGVDGVRLWNVRERRQLAHIPAVDGGFRCAAFSPDGARLAAGTAGGSVRIWDLSTLDQVAAISKGTSWHVHSVMFARDGREVVIADDWNMLICDAIDKARPRQLAVSSSILTQVAVSPDGAMLASLARDRAVRLWQLAGDGPRTWLEPPPESQAYLHMAAVSPDAASIGVVNESGIPNIWRTADLAHVASLPGPRVRTFDITFSPDGAQVATGGADGAVRVWDVAARTMTRQFQAHAIIPNLRFSPDGAILATCGEGGSLKLWNTEDWSLRAELSTGPDLTRMVRFAPDGTLLANNQAGRLLFIDPGTGAILDQVAEDNAFWALDVSADGGRFALGDAARAVRIYDLPTRRVLHRLAGHHEIIWSVAFSSDGALLASESGDGMLKLWDARRGRCLLTTRADDQGLLFPLQFIPGSHRLVTSHGYRGAAIWDFTYFDRFLAGNADAQIRRFGAGRDPEELAPARRWVAGLRR